MMRVLVAVVFLVPLVVTAAAGEVPREPRERVDHHVRQATELADHFDQVRDRECPRFASREEFQAYIDRELDRLVLLVAHVEQAWVEAKTTGDDTVRQAAKVPRRRLDGARSLVDKLQGCAEDHGTQLQPGAIWAKIQRDLPRRQSEIALPSLGGGLRPPSSSEGASTAPSEASP